jgi:hypothetical protein
VTRRNTTTTDAPNSGRAGPPRIVDPDLTTPTALLSALALAHEHGGAAEALRVTGMDLDELERFKGATEDVERLLSGRAGDASLNEALALGFLAGRVAHRPRPRRSFDPTSFLMDHDLLVRSAEGESILRLPWFDERLFVGRQLPEISEMPPHVLQLCVTNYRAALAGDRAHFEFTSYGHAYRVEAVPVRGDNRAVEAVLAVAAPAPPPLGRLRAAAALERAAEALETSARLAEHHSTQCRVAGEPAGEAEQREAAAQARRTARRARTMAWRHRSNSPGPFP